MQEKEVRLLMEISPEREIARNWQQGVVLQRTRTVKAGQLLYCDSYPIWDTAHERRAKAALEKARGLNGTRDAQRKLNARNAQKRLEQLINANFGQGDMLITCTYPEGRQPEDEERAHRDARNYIARLKRLCARLGKPAPRYVYVTEMTQSGRRGTRYHHHMVLHAEGISREEAEKCWYQARGGICNIKRAQNQREGLTGWAKYISKQVCAQSHQQIATKRRWCASKGLRTPKADIADKKISRRRVEKIAQEMDGRPEEAKRNLEAVYPGYEVLEIRVRTSEWASGAYIYAVLAKKERDANEGKRWKGLPVRGG